MSGIAGIIHFDGKPIEPGLIEKMTGAMAHRRPDGINHWVKESVALGQCMLRTTPESLEEHQPLTNEDESLVLVMDGRVDNWEELRGELLGRGAVLRNRADAELVLRAYEIWGRDCLAHIDGDFALAIWDTRRREAFCARDRLGHKPFNYHWDGEVFSFASESRAILDLPWVRQEPNEGVLVEFLAAEWYSRDETLWNGILRLVAAHRMVVGPAGLQLEQYWEPDLWATLPYTKDEEYIEHYRELLTDSIRRLSRSHRPVAYEVSGGLDSSAVFCIAENLRRLGKLPTAGITGYTLAFTDDDDANELRFARAVGDYLGIPVQEVAPSVLPLSWYAEYALTTREFPGFPNGVMHADIRKQAAQQGSRVLLTGEGGDEWVQGSRKYYAEELAHGRWHLLANCFRTDVGIFGARQALIWLSRYGVFPLLPTSLRRLARRMHGRKLRDGYWLTSDTQQAVKLRRKEFYLYQNRPLGGIIQRQMLQILHDAFYVQAIEGVERLGAHFGVEIRDPLRTSRFIQYAFSTPERLRLRGDQSKYIHVKALQSLMPSAVLERRNKAEFSIVFRGHLDRMKEWLAENLPLRRADWVTPDGMARLFKDYQDNPQAGRPLWILWSIYGCDVLMH